MKTIEQTYVVKAPIDQVWEALTNSKVIEEWTGSSAEFDPNINGEFKLWGGDIHGFNTKVSEPTVLEEDWYSNDEEDPHHCYKVRFTLSEVSGQTTIKLIHADVPDNKFKDYADGWRDYYFNPLKDLLEKK